jgi:hypothetical protein
MSEWVNLAPELTGAFYFEYFINPFLEVFKKYAHVGNDIYFRNAKYQSKIRCILLYTKKIKLCFFV